MNTKVSILLAIASYLAIVSAECPNACSAHGKCGAYDMCSCFRNWMSNDCSERVCQFGLAHVDTPKGDLDASSGKLSGPSQLVVVNSDMYPYGTTEQYPSVSDIDGNPLTNTAHEYRECSNKGICDRSTGTCACFEGYDGAACQRASCPSTSEGVCSGHGTCETIAEISARDFNNIYKLWDEHSTMGCVCDGGYTGADCSVRQCKYGVDPYYKDNNATVRYQNTTYEFYLLNSGKTLSGNYSIVFYDTFGEDWQTSPISIDAECSEVTAALEALPNNVIPDNSVRCYKHEDTSSTNVGGLGMYIMRKYTVAFPQNPGKLKQFEINSKLDGNRPTLYSNEETSTLGWHIYSDGYLGEDTDYINDRCFDVTVSLSPRGNQLGAGGFYLNDLDTTEIKLLKRCLGDSNGDDSDNVDVYNWDTGSARDKGILTNPHLIKLQDATQYQYHYRTDANGIPDYDPVLQHMPKSLLCDTSSGNPLRFGTYNGYGFCANHDAPGFYAILYHDGTDFRVLINSQVAFIYDTSTPFWIYTTKGHLQLVSPTIGFYTAISTWSNALQAKHYHTNVLHSTNFTMDSGSFGDVSCENADIGKNSILDCLNKNDMVMVFSGNLSSYSPVVNPTAHNIYSIKRIGFINRPESADREFATTPSTRQEIVLDNYLNTQFVKSGSTSQLAHVYKFYPPAGYRHSQPCSGRGTCNGENGLCECFPGYGGDSCSCQNCGLTV